MSVLLNNVSVDTDGAALTTDGGNKTVSVDATSFGSGTVTIEGRRPSGPWIVLTIAGSPATFTANAIRMIDRLGQGMEVRATLTGSTGANAVNVYLFN